MLSKISSKGKLLAAAAVSAGLLAAPAAHADYWHRGWGGPRYYPHYYHRGPFIGPVIAGTVLGLGAAALAAGAFAPPPVYYAPPPVYAPPPPAYYAPPGYYGGY